MGLSTAASAIVGNEQKLREVYQLFHERQTQGLKTQAQDELKNLVKKQRQANNPALEGISDEQIFAGLPLIERIITTCTEDEWVGYLTKGEMPPVKLNGPEMELMKGGEICIVGGGV